MDSNSICFSPHFIMLFFIVVVGIVMAANYAGQKIAQNLPSTKEIIKYLPFPQQTQTQPTQISIVPPDGLSTGASKTDIPKDDVTLFHQVGFLYDTASLTRNSLKLFARRKYYRSERYEYFIIDQNNNKVPFTLKNDKMIEDGDTVLVPTIGNLTAKIYDTASAFRYVPFV